MANKKIKKMIGICVATSMLTVSGGAPLVSATTLDVYGSAPTEDEYDPSEEKPVPEYGAYVIEDEYDLTKEEAVGVYGSETVKDEYDPTDETAGEVYGPAPVDPVEDVTVTFNSNGGTEVEAQSVEPGDRIKKPENPTRPGYEFVKWLLDGEEYDFDTKVAKSIELEADWTTTVTFVDTERLFVTIRNYVNSLNAEDYQAEGWQHAQSLMEKISQELAKGEEADFNILQESVGELNTFVYEELPKYEISKIEEGDVYTPKTDNDVYTPKPEDDKFDPSWENIAEVYGPCVSDEEREKIHDLVTEIREIVETIPKDEQKDDYTEASWNAVQKVVTEFNKQVAKGDMADIEKLEKLKVEMKEAIQNLAKNKTEETDVYTPTTEDDKFNPSREFAGEVYGPAPVEQKYDPSKEYPVPVYGAGPIYVELPVGTVHTDTTTKASYKVTETGQNAAVLYNGVTDENATEVVVPDTITANGVTYQVTGISEGAFKGNKNITSVTLSDGITQIPDNAFAGCSNLKKVVIGERVTSIGKNAFKNCKNVKRITIKTRKLVSKKVAKNAFKGIKTKSGSTVKVFVLSKKYVKKYKALLEKKGLSVKVKVMK